MFAVCAELYEHGSFGGADLKIGETNQYNLFSNWENSVSSVKITQGCTLKLFENYNEDVLLDTIIEDNTFLEEHNDKASSVSCSCQGKL